MSVTVTDAFRRFEARSIHDVEVFRVGAVVRGK
jgi:hypothetical protein